MEPKATRRSVLAMGVAAGTAPLLPVITAHAQPAVIDVSDCRDDVDIVIKVTAQHFGIASAALTGPSRTSDIVRPRQVAMYLAWVMTGRSLPELGRRFGGRDHTTVLHASRKVADLADNDPAMRICLEEIGARCVDPVRNMGTPLLMLPVNTRHCSWRRNFLDRVPRIIS